MHIPTIKVIRVLLLEEYDKQLEGLTLQVWVNPPLALRQRFADASAAFAAALKTEIPEKAPPDTEQKLVDEALRVYDEVRVSWLSEILSQGAEGTHVTSEEVNTKRQEDPAFFDWLMRRVGKMLAEHQAAEKKD